MLYVTHKYMYISGPPEGSLGQDLAAEKCPELHWPWCCPVKKIVHDMQNVQPEEHGSSGAGLQKRDVGRGTEHGSKEVLGVEHPDTRSRMNNPWGIM